MLRCPQCNRFFREGSQKFCDYDAARLVPTDEQPQPTRQMVSGAMARHVLQNSKTSDKSPAASVADKSATPAQVAKLPIDSLISVLRNQTDDNTNRAASPTEPTLPLEMPVESPLESTVAEQSVAPQLKAADSLSGHNPLKDFSVSAAFKPESLLGQTVRERYLVQSIVAKNQTTTTYQAYDTLELEKTVLLRVWHIAVADAGDKNRFLDEKVTLLRINHPSIARVYDAGELPDGGLFVVSENIAGETLRALIHENKVFAQAHVGLLVRQIAQALSEAHNNRVLHRELTPNKIIVQRFDATESARVVDFSDGINRGKNSLFAVETVDDLVYLAPEQLEGQPATVESDIFALGVIAYELLTGRRPFAGSNLSALIAAERSGLTVLPTDVRDDLTADVDRVIAKALAFDAANRFHHAREFGESLLAALDSTGSERDDRSQAEVRAEAAATEENALTAEPVVIPPIIGKPNNTENGDAAVATVDAAKAEAEPAAVDVAPVVKTPKKIPLPELPDVPGLGVQPERRDGAPSLSKPPAIVSKPMAAKPAAAAKTGAYLPLAAAVLIGVILMTAALFATGNIQPLGGATTRPTVSKRIDQPPPIVVPEQPKIENVEPAAPIQPTSANNAALTPTTLAVPANYVVFSNDRAQLDGKLNQKFVGFSIAHPDSWQRNPREGVAGASNFLHVANRRADDLPVNQLYVSWYESLGTFDADQKTFPRLAKKLVTAYTPEIFRFKQISMGETKLNGRDAYELKFEGVAPDERNKPKLDEQGNPIKLFGRVIFLPVGQEKATSGILLTLLATTLSPDVKSVNDVGEVGELAQILKTLEIKPQP